MNCNKIKQSFLFLYKLIGEKRDRDRDLIPVCIPHVKHRLMDNLSTFKLQIDRVHTEKFGKLKSSSQNHHYLFESGAIAFGH